MSTTKRTEEICCKIKTLCLGSSLALRVSASAVVLAFLLVAGAALPAQDAPVFPAPGCSATNQGLISNWNFDESLGLAIDQGDGNNGILGASITRVPGITGSGAVSFDNTSSAYINVGPGINNDFSFTTGMTISLLSKPNWTGDLSDYDDFFRKDDGNDRILLAFQNDNGVCCPFFGGGGKGQVLSFGLNIGGIYDEIDMPLDGLNGRPSLSQLEDGNAHLIVATYDSTTGVKAVFIDGLLAMSKTYPIGTLISSGGTADAIIGNWKESAPAFGEPFNGIIDELRIYNRALTTGETQCVQFTSVLADIKSSLAQRLIDNPGIAEALYGILNAAARSASFGNNGAAANQLNAAMLFVKAQQSQHIDQTTAQRLLSELTLLLRLSSR